MPGVGAAEIVGVEMATLHIEADAEPALTTGSAQQLLRQITWVFRAARDIGRDHHGIPKRTFQLHIVEMRYASPWRIILGMPGMFLETVTFGVLFHTLERVYNLRVDLA